MVAPKVRTYDTLLLNRRVPKKQKAISGAWLSYLDTRIPYPQLGVSCMISPENKIQFNTQAKGTWLHTRHISEFIRNISEHHNRRQVAMEDQANRPHRKAKQKKKHSDG